MELAELREVCLHARDRRGRVIVVSTAVARAIASELAGHWNVRTGWDGSTAGSDRETFEMWEQVLEGLVEAAKPVLWVFEEPMHARAKELVAFLTPAIRALPVIVLKASGAKVDAAGAIGGVDPCTAAGRARDSGDARAFAEAALAVGDQRHLEEALERLGARGTWSEEERIGSDRPTREATTPDPLHCRVRAKLATVLRAPRAALAMLREALADARSLRDDALLAQLLATSLPPLADVLEPTELRELATEARTLAGPPGSSREDLAHGVAAHELIVLADAKLGDMAALDRDLDATLELAGRAGHPRRQWSAQLLASMRAVARGQFAESERRIAEVERAVQIVDDPAATRALALHRHYRALDLHRETTVTKGMAALELGPLERGLVSARFGDAGGAARSLLGVVIDDIETPTALAMLGEICAAGGSAEQRAHALARLAPLVDRHSAFGHTYGGPVRRVVGLLELSVGNRAVADQQLRRALDFCRAHGFATWVARISFELGDLDAAGRLAQNLGIRGLAKRTRTPAEGVAPPTRPSLGVFRDSDGWRITFGIRVAHVPAHRGMDIIARLVERPGEEVHEIVLGGSRRERANVLPWIREALARIHDQVIADYLRSAIRTGTYCAFRP